MRTMIWIAVFSIIANRGLAAPCAPEKPIHIIFRDVTPGIDSASFGARPRSLYRLGDGKERSEEAYDPAENLHQLSVTDEPNIWMANLADGTGLHAVDPGPTYFTRIPAFIGEGVSPQITALEFGCEAEFIRDNGLKPIRVEQIDDEDFDVYRFELGAEAVEILEKRRMLHPGLTRYYRSGKLMLAWRYDLYETELKTDPTWFTVPPGIKWEEQIVK